MLLEMLGLCAWKFAKTELQEMIFPLKILVLEGHSAIGSLQRRIFYDIFLHKLIG